MLSPLCVSHSRQAETHERQPMQREGSRKIFLTVSTICFLYRNVGFGLASAIGSSRRCLRADTRAATSSSFAQSGFCGASVATAAHTLYSGIFIIGSKTGLVS